MGVIIGRSTDPGNGADNYGLGFHAGFRLVIPSTGSPTKTITKIGGWVTSQGVPTTEAFRFAISNADNSNNQNEETDVASRIYYSPANILLSTLITAGGQSANFQETVSIPIAAGAVIFAKQLCTVAGDVRFKYLDGQTGQRIYDGYYGGTSVPPADPLNPSEINYYDDFVYGIWIEVEDAAGDVYSITGTASLIAGGSAKTKFAIKAKGVGQLSVAGSFKSKLISLQKSVGNILLAGVAKISNLFSVKSSAQIVMGGAAKQRLISKNIAAGNVSFSGAAKVRQITSYIGVGGMAASGAAKTSLQINTVTLSVVGSGGFIASGAAKLKTILLQKSVGQISAAGFSSLHFSYRNLGLGAVVVGGQARTKYVFSGKSVGSILFSGSTKNRFVYKSVSAGNIAIVGAAKIRQLTSYIGVGGMVVGGAAKTSLAMSTVSLAAVGIGSFVFSGNAKITLLPEINWYQNIYLTVYYKLCDRRVVAKPFDRRLFAIPLDRTVKYRV